MVIREIKKIEIDKLLNLYTHLHRKDVPLPEKSKLMSIWEEITTNPRLLYFVLDIDNEIVSSCTLSIIQNLTHAEYRRRGFGASILQHTLEVAWEHKCYKVMLLTGSKDPAIHQFYEKTGFQKGLKTGFVANASDYS